MATKQKKNANSFATVIGWFFLMSSVVFGVFVVYEDNLNINKEEGQADFASTHKNNDIDNVNEHMRSVADKMELERMKTLVGNLKAEHGVSRDSAPQTSAPSDQPIVDFSNDPRERQLAQDLGRTNDVVKEGKDPRSQAYAKVIDNRLAAQYNELMRKQQAKEFVARARKDGWIVTLDKNYKIKSYEPVDEDSRDPVNVDYRGYEVAPPK